VLTGADATRDESIQATPGPPGRAPGARPGAGSVEPRAGTNGHRRQQQPAAL